MRWSDVLAALAATEDGRLELNRWVERLNAKDPYPDQQDLVQFWVSMLAADSAPRSVAPRSYQEELAEDAGGLLDRQRLRRAVKKVGGEYWSDEARDGVLLCILVDAYKAPQQGGRVMGKIGRELRNDLPALAVVKAGQVLTRSATSGDPKRRLQNDFLQAVGVDPQREDIYDTAQYKAFGRYLKALCE